MSLMDTSGAVSTDADTASALAVLADLDLTIVEGGPAVSARKCSTDNGCDTVAGSDC